MHQPVARGRTNVPRLSLAAAESIILALVISVLSFGFLRLVQKGRR
ncbi:hypothetical protein [Nonomuraea terrae]|nr:hypothetical protein [Nonomuraea terrae]